MVPRKGHITHHISHIAVCSWSKLYYPTTHQTSHHPTLPLSPENKKKEFSVFPGTRTGTGFGPQTQHRGRCEGKGKGKGRVVWLVGSPSLFFFFFCPSVPSVRPSVCRFGSVHPSTHKHRTEGTKYVCGQNIKKRGFKDHDHGTSNTLGTKAQNNTTPKTAQTHTHTCTHTLAHTHTTSHSRILTISSSLSSTVLVFFLHP